MSMTPEEFCADLATIKEQIGRDSTIAVSREFIAEVTRQQAEIAALTKERDELEKKLEAERLHRCQAVIAAGEHMKEFLEKNLIELLREELAALRQTVAVYKTAYEIKALTPAADDGTPLCQKLDDLQDKLDRSHEAQGAVMLECDTLRALLANWREHLEGIREYAKGADPMQADMFLLEDVEAALALAPE